MSKINHGFNLKLLQDGTGRDIGGPLPSPLCGGREDEVKGKKRGKGCAGITYTS
jgi:hypothetical protein